MNKNIYSSIGFRYIFEIIVIVFSVTLSFYIQDILNEREKIELKNKSLKGVINDLAKDFDLDVANYNAPGQIVISGEIEKIRSALTKVKDYGCRMGKELEVAGAYHSRLMIQAQQRLAQELEKVSFSNPNFPVVSNVDAIQKSGEFEISSSLERQVTGSVRWSQSMENLLNEGHDLFIEFSPKPVLAGLMSRIRKGTNVISVGNPETINSALETLSS